MNRKMTTIPLPLRKEIEKDPFYSICAKAGIEGHDCEGKITWEHALYFGGSKVQKKFALVPICEYGHGVNTHQDGGDMDKNLNEWIALSLSTSEERFSISKAENKEQRLKYLETIYGKYDKELAIISFEKIKAERGYIKNNILYIGNKVSMPEKSKEKKEVKDKFWYPLSKEERDLVAKAIEFHKEIEDLHYTPFEMIRRMIIEYQPDAARYQANVIGFSRR